MEEPAEREDHQPIAQPHTTSPKRGMWRAGKRGTRAAARCICPCVFRKKKEKNSLANDTPFINVMEPVVPAFSIKKPTLSVSSSSVSEPSQRSSAMKGSKTGSSASSDRISEPSPPSLSTRFIEGKSWHLTLESFTFHHSLGEGAFGKVLLASHIASKMQLAVKIVKKRDLIEDNIYEALIERQALEKTRHNLFITHLFGAFQTEEYLFFAMEYVSGGDLRKLICAKSPLPGNTVRILTAEILCGLQHLHTIGIIHRDIKPQNILLNSTGHAKIADFGLAAIRVFQPRKITGCVGTPSHMAPEIYLEQPYDAMVDYFSLGITVYHMAVGRHPYYRFGMNIPKMELAITTSSPRYPKKMDTILLNLIERLLEKDQEKRRKILSNIREHPFFEEINWAELENGEAPPLLFAGRHLKTPSRKKLKRLIVADILSSEDKGCPIPPGLQQVFCDFSFMSEKLKVEITSPPSKPGESTMSHKKSSSKRCTIG